MRRRDGLLSGAILLIAGCASGGGTVPPPEQATKAFFDPRVSFVWAAPLRVD